jgi:hypothetical protein
VQQLGYNYNTNHSGDTHHKEERSYNDDHISEALSLYKAHYQDKEPPDEFTVQHGSTMFPEHLWGLHLGPIYHEKQSNKERKDLRRRVQDLEIF